MSRPEQIAVAVVEHDGRFLVGRRSENQSLPGLWEFPGGKIAPGEPADAAARRECLEETGLEVEVLGQYPGVVWDYPHGLVSLHFFACRLAGNHAEPASGYRFVTREELAQLEFPAANAMLLERLLA